MLVEFTEKYGGGSRWVNPQYVVTVEQVMEDAMKKYDAESVYDEQIQPLMAEIIEICKQHEIPMLATFQLNNEGSDPGGSGSDLWCSTLLARFEHGNNSRLLRGHQAMSRGDSFAFSMMIPKTKTGEAK